MMTRRTDRRRLAQLRRAWLALGLACAAVLALAPGAWAAAEWEIESRHGDQHLAPGRAGQYLIQVRNVGDAPSAGACPGPDCVTIVDTLPPRVTATGFIVGFDTDFFGNNWSCSGTTVVTCELSGANSIFPAGPAFIETGMAPPVYVTVDVAPDASGTHDNEVTVSGGGAASPATDRDPTTFSADGPGFGLTPGTFFADAFDGSGAGAAPEREAGSHPSELRMDFDLNLKYTDDPLRGGQFVEPDGQVRDVEVRLPPGTLGNPEATPKCQAHALEQILFNVGAACPIDSQVGIASVTLNNGNRVTSGYNRLPIYNMVPPPGAVAAFAFSVQGLPVWIKATLDPVDYSIVATVDDANALAPFSSTSVRLWGVPADSSHDPLRFNPDDLTGFSLYGLGATAARRAFLTLPSQCDTSGVTSITVRSWETPVSTSSDQSDPALMTGCERQQFNASISVVPTAGTPDTPTGLSVDVSVPQDDTPTGLATPPVRKVVVQFPEGTAVSPSSADGLAGCTLAQIGLGTAQPVACPDASKIGTATVVTPLLADPVKGSVYLATQNDNPFGTLIALYIVLEDRARGLLIKLPGEIALDEATQRVTATFDNNPQFPFSNLNVQLKSGSRAPLVTPLTCGVQTATAEITSWNSALPAIQASSSFEISGDGNGAPCTPPGLDPGFRAGTIEPVAGKSSPLTMTLTRKDRDQELQGLSLDLPGGLLGRIADTVPCPEIPAQQGACDEISKIGDVTTAAGPGATPLHISGGRAYITGPYKGAPYGLSIVVPAKAGPFDLGNVVVRAAIFIDPQTTALRIVSDPFPRSVRGIPLRIRSVNVLANRAGFILNPTNCFAKRIDAQITGYGGGAASRSSHFQVAGCNGLAFRPRMRMRVGGRLRNTRRGQSTRVRAALTMPREGANIRKVAVTLPRVLNARLDVINRACTPEEYRSGDCEDARAGTAVAITPLLRDPLRGGAYFVRTPGQALPDLMVALRGEVDIDLVGTVRIPGGIRLKTTFAAPDAPISKFRLNLVAGRRGPVGVARNLCSPAARRSVVKIRMRGQNGRLYNADQVLRVSGCRRARGRRRQR